MLVSIGIMFSLEEFWQRGFLSTQQTGKYHRGAERPYADEPENRSVSALFVLVVVRDLVLQVLAALDHVRPRTQLVGGLQLDQLRLLGWLVDLQDDLEVTVALEGGDRNKVRIT